MGAPPTLLYFGKLAFHMVHVHVGCCRYALYVGKSWIHHWFTILINTNKMINIDANELTTDILKWTPKKLSSYISGITGNTKFVFNSRDHSTHLMKIVKTIAHIDRFCICMRVCLHVGDCKIINHHNIQFQCVCCFKSIHFFVTKIEFITQK